MPHRATRRATMRRAALTMMSVGLMPSDLNGQSADVDPDPASTISAATFDAPTFFDNFRADDADRWMRPDPGNWPPKPGTKGRWARHFFWGWPWSLNASDVAARNLRASYEAQCYEDQGVRTGQDGLELVGTRSRSNRFRFPWISGIVAQNPNLGLTYGYFEMVAKLPAGRGLWPTFWLVGPGAAPEIDICEVLGDDMTKLHCTLHYIKKKSTAVTVPDLSKAYHKFGLLWTKESLTWYFDDRPVARRDTPPTASVPMYMQVNLAVGGVGSWPGPTDRTTPSPAIMRVASVASYKLGSWGDKPIPATPAAPT